MVGLSSALVVDLQLEILEQLQVVSPRSLLNVSLSSRTLYRYARGLIYRVIHFTFTEKRCEINRRLIDNLLALRGLGLQVQELIIHWAPNAKLLPGEGSKADFERLRVLLPRLTNLKTFIWNAQYPIQQWLLDALCLCSPYCKLYIRAPISNSVIRDTQSLRALPYLYSLQVSFTRSPPPWRPGDLRDLIIQQNHKRRLKDLAIEWDDIPSGPSYLENLPSPLQLRSLEMGVSTHSYRGSIWQCSVAWSMLERLAISDIPFSSDLAPQLTALKILRLRLHRGDDKQVLLDMLREKCPNLRSLDLTACTADINRRRGKLWNDFGHNLESLRIHEDACVDERPILSLLELESIARNCCKLRSLGLDLDYSGQSGYRTLMTVADHFWAIEHLDVNIEIAKAEGGPSVLPKATIEGAGQLWNYLWHQMACSWRKVMGGNNIPRLRSLDVVGQSFDAEPELRFQVNISERDDEARAGIASVKCVELEAVKSVLGPAGPYRNAHQEDLMKALRTAAEDPFRFGYPRNTPHRELMRTLPFWDRLDQRRFYYK